MLSRQLALHDFNKFNENPRMSEMEAKAISFEFLRYL